VSIGIKKLNIAFRSLLEGNHEFNLLIDKTFIELFAVENISDISINVLVTMLKRERHLELTLVGKGTVVVPCDRCLELFTLFISFNNNVIVKTDAKTTEIVDENLIHVAENQETLDLSQYIYESLMLSIPLKKVHPNENQCNAGVIKKLTSNNSKIKNKKDIDPRWDSLKNINF